MLIPIALFLGFGFLVVFVWMSGRGQFDDLVTPSQRLLLEEVDQVGSGSGKLSWNGHHEGEETQK